MTWYKIAQNAQSKLDEFDAQRKALKDQLSGLSQTYLDMDEKDKDAAMAFYEKEIEPVRKVYREIDRNFEQEIKKLMSLGLMTQDEAKQRGYMSSGHEHLGWKPLPQVLYHVTTAKSKVLSEGLKTRQELNQLNGVGLGGGEDNTISFTSDLKVAYAILNGLLEMKKVVEGKLTVRQMLEMAKDGVGAKVPYYDKLVEGATHAVGNLDDLADGYMQTSSIARPPDDKHEWLPVEESGWQGRDQRYYSRWKRKRDEKEQLFALYMFYGRFSGAREEAGGIENPLFFSADVKALANIPEAEIAILQFKPKPNAMGYPVGGLLEWRVGTGQNVDFVKEIKAPQQLVAKNWYHLFKENQ